jgi:hypothetical protein
VLEPLSRLSLGRLLDVPAKAVPIESTGEVLRFFRDLMDGAPRDLYGWFGLGTVPPAPGFPEALHMRKVALIIWCHLGSAEEANAALAPARKLGPPLLDGVGEVPFPGLQAAFDDLYPKGLQWYWRHDFVRELSDEAIERHAEFGLKLPTPTTSAPTRRRSATATASSPR